MQSDRRSKSFTAPETGERSDSAGESEPEPEVDGAPLLGSLWGILTSSLPAVLSNLASTLIETINLLFIGTTLGPEYIAAVGISYCWSNVAAYSWLMGIASTVESLCCQDLEKKDVLASKVHYNRGRTIVLVLTLAYVAVFFWFAGGWLDLINLPSTLSARSQTYLRYSVPGFVFLMQFEVSKQYASSLHIEKAQAILTVATTAAHALWCYLLIDVGEFGFVGAAIAMSITHFLNFAGFNVLLALMGNGEECQAWGFGQVTEDWFGFIKAGLPSALTISFEWLGVELLTIESAYLSTSELATTVIIQNVTSLAYMASWGISVSGAGLIESAIDERKIVPARQYALRAVTTTAVLLLVLCLALFRFRCDLADIFVNDQDTRNRIVSLLENTILVSVGFDGLQSVLGGVIRGLGNDGMASYGNLACYYLLTQPFAITLGFVVGLGVEGLWIAMAIGLFCNSVFFLGIVVSHDWTNIEVENIVFGPEENREMLTKSENVGNYNSPEAKKILGLMQNTFG